MKNHIYFLATSIAFIVFWAAISSCKTAEQPQQAVETSKVEEPAKKNPSGVKTYVNTNVNNATGNISTILLFNEITEVTAIHPRTRERFILSVKDYKYNSETTELKITLPEGISYGLKDLSYHIVGLAADPGIFVLAGIDSKRKDVGVFFNGKKTIEGKDYSYDKSTNRITSLVQLNVDTDSFQICWATKKGVVNFSNNTQKFKDAYQKFYNEWAHSINLSN